MNGINERSELFFLFYVKENNKNENIIQVENYTNMIPKSHWYLLYWTLHSHLGKNYYKYLFCLWCTKIWLDKDFFLISLFSYIYLFYYNTHVKVCFYWNFFIALKRASIPLYFRSMSYITGSPSNIHNIVSAAFSASWVESLTKNSITCCKMFSSFSATLMCISVFWLTTSDRVRQHSATKLIMEIWVSLCTEFNSWDNSCTNPVSLKNVYLV